MADDKIEEKVQKQEAQPIAPQGKKKLSLLLVIIIVVAGLAIGGGGAVTYLILKGKSASEKQQVKGDKEKKKEEGAKETGSHGSKSEKGGLSVIKSIEPSFIVNLAGGARTYLKVDMALELSDKKVEAEIESKLPMIKDTIVLVLSEQTPESVSDNKGKLRLKDELLKRVNSLLTSGKVLNIYFTSFVVQ